MEIVAIEKHIAGMPAYADRYIAHQFHAMLIGIFAQGAPLAKAKPLNESKEPEAVIHAFGVARPQMPDVLSRLVRRVGGDWPFVPGERFAVKLHQIAKKAVVREPILFGRFESLAFVVQFLCGGGKLRPCKFQQVAFYASHRRVVDACGLAGYADLVGRTSEIRIAEPRDLRAVECQVNRIERG